MNLSEDTQYLLFEASERAKRTLFVINALFPNTEVGGALEELNRALDEVKKELKGK